jgi:hypothetical protein
MSARTDDFVILAAGPVYDHPDEGPYRRVVLKWPTGTYSCHVQSVEDGSVSGGYYVQKLVLALRRWHRHMDDDLYEYPSSLRLDFQHQ